MTTPNPISVVAAVITRQDGCVLLAKRAAHQHQGGKWEFPGGKVEPGENKLRALSRELEEELGIYCNLAQPLMTIRHNYSDKSVLLHFYAVSDWLGQAQGQEGQALEWVPLAKLTEYDFPQANQPLVRALQLGGLVLVWPQQSPAHWEIRLHLAMQRGIGVFYARNVTDEALLRQQCAICHQHGAKLLVTDDVTLMQRVSADGVHLKAATAANIAARPAVPLLSVACHSAQELDCAERLQADMALLSPVQASECKPDAALLGWNALSEMVTGRSLAVFAMGGVGPANLTQARAKGAFGVAGISKFWPPEQLMHK